MKIIGVNINLRDRTMSDLQTYQRWMTPSAEWKRWDAPWEPIQPLNDADLMEWPLRLNMALSQNPRRRLEIESADGEHLGMVSWYWVDERTTWADAGIVVWNPEYWSKGLGQEAFELWTDYLFSSTNWARLGLGTWSGNARMTKLAERLGYKLEATFRQARVVNGERFDAVRYGMLREDWQHADWIGCSSARE